MGTREDLYPTPTRLALLRQVANWQCLTDITVDEFAVYLFPDAPTSWQNRVKVTARIREMELAGWIAERVPDWQPTEAGRAVLDSHPSLGDRTYEEIADIKRLEDQ